MGKPENPWLFGADYSDASRDLPVFYTEITLRDLFAAAAVSSIANDGYHKWNDLASDAYNIADALLAERAREGSEDV